MDTFTEQLKEFFNTLRLLFSFVVNDIRTKPRTFRIGIFSIFLVVAFLVILQSLLQLTPILFIKLAEDQNGQADLVFSPIPILNRSKIVQDDSNSLSFRTVNFTHLEHKLSGIPEIKAIAPRWTLPVNISRTDTPDKNSHAMGIALDSPREREQGIGDQLQLLDLKEGECWISQSIASLLELNRGEVLLLKADILGTLLQSDAVTVGGNSNKEKIAELIAQKLIEKYPVSDALSSSGIGNVSNSTEKVVKDNKNIIKSAIRAGTKDDGTINADLLNGVLLATGLIPQPIPSEIVDNVPASDLENILDTSTDSEEAGSTFGRRELVKYLKPVIIDTLNINEPYQVIETVALPKGKWSENFGNVVALDSKYLSMMLMRRFFKALNETQVNTGNQIMDNLLNKMVTDPKFINTVKTSFVEFDINEYALAVNTLLNDRESVYDSQEDLRPNLIKASDSIFSYLGANYPAVLSAPLADALANFFVFKSFLDNTFIAVVFILTLLAILLIYSLLNSNVEEKKYEFGMLRVLGIKRKDLIALMGIQSLFFAVPGLIFGFILALALNSILSYLIFDYALLKTSYQLPISSICLGAGIGIIIPLISNILPIRNALSNTLRDSLNAYSRSISNIVIHIARLASLGISPSMLIAAITLIVLGVISFYLAPYAYIFSNMPMFFTVLNVVLLVMILGLTLLANLIRTPLEKLTLNILLLIFYRNKPLMPVIDKNFVSHAKRNNKTSLMFTLALAFLIFAGVALKVNSNLIIQQLQTTLGSDIVVTALPYESSFLKEANIRAAIEDFKLAKPDIVRDYAFTSQPFSAQPQVQIPQIAPLTTDPNLEVEIIGVDESYLRSVYEEFYISKGIDPAVNVSEVPNSQYKDGVQALYVKDKVTDNAVFDQFNIVATQNISKYGLDSFLGKQDVRLMIPESIGKELSLKAGKLGLVAVGSVKFRSHIRNIAKKVPGFAFTGYKSESQGTILTSHEDFRTIRDAVWARKSNSSDISDAISYNKTIPENSSYGIPKLGLLVRLNEGVSKEDRIMLFNVIQTLIDGKFTFITDVVGMVETFENALFFTDVFFILVSAIAVILAFFFTLVAFVGNVTENLWEFGVLRAIGLTRSQVTKAYVFEALSLIFSAIALGTGVGVALAVIITVQFNLFMELPFKLIFPVPVFVFTVVASLLISVAGPRAAIEKVKYKHISSIIKALE